VDCVSGSSLCQVVLLHGRQQSVGCGQGSEGLVEVKYAGEKNETRNIKTCANADDDSCVAGCTGRT
jgi:hypothetical protein